MAIQAKWSPPSPNNEVNTNRVNIFFQIFTAPRLSYLNFLLKGVSYSKSTLRRKKKGGYFSDTQNEREASIDMGTIHWCLYIILKKTKLMLWSQELYNSVIKTCLLLGTQSVIFNNWSIQKWAWNSPGKGRMNQEGYQQPPPRASHCRYRQPALPGLLRCLLLRWLVCTRISAARVAQPSLGWG